MKRAASPAALPFCGRFSDQQSRMPVGRADALFPAEAPLPVEPVPVFVPAAPVVVPPLIPLEPLVPLVPVVPLVLPVTPVELPVPVPLELLPVPLALPVVPDTFDVVRIWFVAVS